MGQGPYMGRAHNMGLGAGPGPGPLGFDRRTHLGGVPWILGGVPRRKWKGFPGPGTRNQPFCVLCVFFVADPFGRWSMAQTLKPKPQHNALSRLGRKVVNRAGTREFLRPSGNNVSNHEPL